ncbi:hypothetical protein Scep_028864 [Stephania cephalantha]|uniref:GDSL esterase/lipase n=1 Tax=Stephania cephalantha TaxID=152367 RepID=A0AAP0EDW1_9MAGN
MVLQGSISHCSSSWQIIHPKLVLLLLLPLLVYFGNKTEAHYKNIPAVIVFGDSTVDAGNNNFIDTIAKGNFAPYGRDFDGGNKPTGRFCNGRLSTDFISDALGIKPFVPAYLDPAYSIEDFATGVTFASASTGYDNLTAQVLNVIPLWKQLEFFKEYKKRLEIYGGIATAQTIIQEAIFVISIGTNDFIVNYYVFPERSNQFTVEEYENFLLSISENFMLEIYKLGARKISLVGVPPIGCLPIVRTVFNLKFGRACREDLNEMSRSFNRKTRDLVSKLRREVKGLKLAFNDPYGLILSVVKHPHSYGIDIVAEGCCGTGVLELGFLCPKSNECSCPDANKYAFWDSVHPTEKLYRIIVDYTLNTTLRELS